MFGGMMQKAKLYSQCNHVPIIFLKRKSAQKVLLTSGDTGVNRGIQLVAQRYCVDCKTTYHELSKIIQVLLNVMLPCTTIFNGQWTLDLHGIKQILIVMFRLQPW